MIKLHHLQDSRSFMIVWLMEELGLPYDLVCHDRLADFTAADTLAAVHPLKKSPVVVDGATVLFESGAIVEYIIHRYGQGRLAVPSHHMDYAPYLIWLHAPEGTCMPALTPIIRHTLGVAPEPTQAQRGLQQTVLSLCNEALAERDYFGGTEFSAADIMMETYLTLASRFVAQDYSHCTRLHAFLDRMRAREGHRRAKEVAEPQDLSPA
jgi:glutathione S-transferase